MINNEDSLEEIIKYLFNVNEDLITIIRLDLIIEIQTLLILLNNGIII